MAKQTVEDKLDILTALVEKGFAAAADDIAGVKTEMRSHFLALSEDIGEIRVELRDINRRLDAFEKVVGNIGGFAKEIDELRARVKDIERHLGMNKKIAA